MRLFYLNFNNINILKYGRDIIKSNGMKSERYFIHHGSISCFEHSLRVAEQSIKLAYFFHINVDKRSLIRGALLHDYFLYDWHISDESHRLHGLIHAESALKNAERDFFLNNIEKDIIKQHMFPLKISVPRYRESWIVCIADKLCAINEIFSL